MPYLSDYEFTDTGLPVVEWQENNGHGPRWRVMYSSVEEARAAISAAEAENAQLETENAIVSSIKRHYQKNVKRARFNLKMQIKKELEWRSKDHSYTIKELLRKEVI